MVFKQFQGFAVGGIARLSRAVIVPLVMVGVMSGAPASAAIITYNDASKTALLNVLNPGFYLEGTWPDGAQVSPYARNGPSPQNTFAMSITAEPAGSIYNDGGALSTGISTSTLVIALTTGNPTVFAADVFGTDSTGLPIPGVITVVATTNQGTATVTASTTSPFVGFSTTGVGEVITSVKFTASQATGIVFPTVDNTYVGRFALCRLDMDGDNQVSAVREGLVLLRSMLGFSGAAVVNGTGITLAQWNAARSNLNSYCGTSLLP